MTAAESVGAPARRRRRALALISLATLGALALWFSTNAVAPALGDEFGFGDGDLAWLTIAVQLGFVAGTLGSALLNLAERVNARRLFAVSALLAAAANVLPLGSDSLAVWLVARTLTGVFLGGVYPPALHIVSGWYATGRGFAIGVVVGALTLGSGSPHLLGALLQGEWRLAMAAASALAVAGAATMWWAVGDGPHHIAAPRVQLAQFWRSSAVQTLPVHTYPYGMCAKRQHWEPIRVKVTFAPLPPEEQARRLRRLAELLLGPRPDEEQQKDGMAKDDGQTTQP